MSKKYTPLHNEVIEENVSGPDCVGIQIGVNLTLGSIWSSSRDGKYHILHKKGSSAFVRCTPAALDKHFREVISE